MKEVGKLQPMAGVPCPKGKTVPLTASTAQFYWCPKCGYELHLEPGP